MKSASHQPNCLVAAAPTGTQLAALCAFAEIPEEEIWLRNFTSAATRRTYRTAVRDFIRTIGLRSVADFRRVERAAIIAWRDHLTTGGASVRTVKTKLSALSSLFNHLVDRPVCDRNPVREVKPPKLRVRRGETKALSAKQARKILDAPPRDSLQGLRDRAILSIGLQVGARPGRDRRIASRGPGRRGRLSRAEAPAEGWRPRDGSDSSERGPAHPGVPRFGRTRWLPQGTALPAGSPESARRGGRPTSPSSASGSGVSPLVPKGRDRAWLHVALDACNVRDDGPKKRRVAGAGPGSARPCQPYNQALRRGFDRSIWRATLRRTDPGPGDRTLTPLSRRRTGSANGIRRRPSSQPGTIGPQV